MLKINLLMDKKSKLDKSTLNYTNYIYLLTYAILNLNYCFSIFGNYFRYFLFIPYFIYMKLVVAN